MQSASQSLAYSRGLIDSEETAVGDEAVCLPCRRLSSPLETRPGRGLWVPSLGLPVFLAPLFLLLFDWDQGTVRCVLSLSQYIFLADGFPVTFRRQLWEDIVDRVDSLSSGGEM